MNAILVGKYNSMTHWQNNSTENDKKKEYPLSKNPNFISNDIQCFQSPSGFPIPKLLNESTAITYNCSELMAKSLHYVSDLNLVTESIVTWRIFQRRDRHRPSFLCDSAEESEREGLWYLQRGSSCRTAWSAYWRLERRWGSRRGRGETASWRRKKGVASGKLRLVMKRRRRSGLGNLLSFGALLPCSCTPLSFEREAGRPLMNRKYQTQSRSMHKPPPTRSKERIWEPTSFPA